MYLYHKKYNSVGIYSFHIWNVKNKNCKISAIAFVISLRPSIRIYYGSINTEPIFYKLSSQFKQRL
jgi:hypothetical protein